MQLIASQGSTCEASSKMTTSKRMSAGRNCDTDSGLIMKHGLRSCTSDRVSASNVRIGLCRVFLAASRLMTDAALLPFELGRRAAHWDTTAA
jgi:hypothetical protein